MIVLDTNTVSAIMRGEPQATRRLLAHRRSDVALPQPVVAEISYGLARLQPSRRRTELSERWQLISRELGRLEWTDAVSSAFGEIKARLESQGERLDDFDIAIAAHAVAQRGTLVTHNLAHFERIPGLEIDDWLG